jgi:transcriptional regulator with XRE-family HTH domain
MGRSTRSRPLKLGKKLKQIRGGLGLSQAQMAKRLEVKGDAIYPASISQYESGQREPSLIVLFNYARLADVAVEVLIDDKLGLPIDKTKRVVR